MYFPLSVYSVSPIEPPQDFVRLLKQFNPDLYAWWNPAVVVIHKKNGDYRKISRWEIWRKRIIAGIRCDVREMVVHTPTRGTKRSALYGAYRPLDKRTIWGLAAREWKRTLGIPGGVMDRERIKKIQQARIERDIAYECEQKRLEAEQDDERRIEFGKDRRDRWKRRESVHIRR